MNDHAPKLWWDREKTLFHFARAWQEKIVRTSTDHGATWSFNDVQLRESDWRPGGKGVRYPGIHTLWYSIAMAASCALAAMTNPKTKRVGMNFKASDGSEFKCFGMFAALSFDDGKTWPMKRLVTPGGPERKAPSIDRGEFTISDTMAESAGYLSATQTRDGNVQLISSKNHYVFNLAWLKQAPPAPRP